MRGHIYRRGTSWGIVIDLPRDASGKRRQQTATVRGTKKEAQARLNRMLHEINTGMFVEPSKTTVEQYLGHWLADYAAHNVARKTYQRYDEFVRLHLVPSIGKQRLDGLQPAHIQKCYSPSLPMTVRQSGRHSLL